jgi:hypothetical protein
VRPLFNRVTLDSHLTGLLFVRIRGGYQEVLNASRDMQQILKPPSTFHLDTRFLLGKFDLMCPFEADRMSSYDYLLTKCLDVQGIDEVFSVPCVRIVFKESPDRSIKFGSQSTVGYVFVKCNLSSEPLANFEKVLAVLEALESGEMQHISASEANDIKTLLAESSDVAVRASFLTYGIFDLLMILESTDPRSLSKFIANLRQTIGSQIYETAAVIGVPDERSPGALFGASVSISTLPGMEQSVLDKLRKVFQKKGFSECRFGWEYGYYDIMCSIKVDDLYLLYQTISKEIRELEGVISTATALETDIGGSLPSGSSKGSQRTYFPIRTGSDFVRQRETIWQMIRKTKKSREMSERIFAERQNSLFSQLEQILYRLRYLRFRWNTNQRYLPVLDSNTEGLSGGVFGQLELTLGDAFEDISSARTWKNLVGIDGKIQDIHRMVCSLERAFHQRLESLDLREVLGMKSRGIEKLGAFEKIFDAMDTVARDYMVESGDRLWRGIVISGVHEEEFETESSVDLVYIPTFAKYRTKTWPLLAHEVGHHVIVPDDHDWQEVRHELGSIVDEYASLFAEWKVDPERIINEIIAEIYATYTAGTCYILSLIDHLFVPPVFFSSEAQHIQLPPMGLPIPLRVEIAKAVLKNRAPRLIAYVSQVEEKMEKVNQAENIVITGHLDLWNTIRNVANEINALRDRPFGPSVEKVFEDYIRVLKRHMEIMARAAGAEADERKYVARAVVTVLDNLLNFCEVEGMYSSHLQNVAKDFRYLLTLLDQIEDFVERLVTPKPLERLSVMQKIFALLKDFPFQPEREYEQTIQKLHGYLKQGAMVQARPNYILEVLYRDRSYPDNLLNANAAIFSILFWGYAVQAPA